MRHTEFSKRLHMFAAIGATLVCPPQFLRASPPRGDAEQAREIAAIWDDPTFQKQFIGAYGINAEIEPRVTPDEVKILEKIRPLMADALRAMKTQPGLVEALQLHLVEMSPRLREIQAEKLVKTISPQWHDTLGQAVEATGGAGVIILANEFFDALPIRQFVRDAQGWHERGHVRRVDGGHRHGQRNQPARQWLPRRSGRPGDRLG